MARVAIWLNVGDQQRTLQAFKWVYLGLDENAPTGNTAQFKVGDGYWSGRRGDELHGVRVEQVENIKVEVSY